MIKIRKNLEGLVFGSLTVIHRANDVIFPSGQRRATWLCSCVCGGQKVVNTGHLNSGHTSSCGCAVGSKPDDLSGKIFGRLTVIALGKRTDGRHVTWECKCSCGTMSTVQAGNLTSGHTMSCGCIHSEVMSKRNGVAHPNWKRGYYVNDRGYIIDSIGKGKQRARHILKAEKVLGRRLKIGEVVHHIDEDKSNFANDNLLICSNSYHVFLHRRMDRLRKTNTYPGTYKEVL